MMAKEVGTGRRKLAYQIIPSTSVVREHASWFLQENVKPGSNLYTDGAGIYKKIDKWWPVYHYRDIHKEWEFELTSEIEGIFGVMRTFIRRMYHHVTGDKLGDYVGEFCYRFCHPEIFDSPYQYLLISLRLVTTR
jgi:transposase-like protein